MLLRFPAMENSVVTYRTATMACLAMGVVLRTVQYGAQASLWLDELALAHTIVVRDLVRLVTEPLAYQQVAPAGFLVLQKIATSALGTGELGFRVVPWLASIAALFVFWRVAIRLLPQGAALLALTLFSGGIAFTSYAGQAKQYSTDVLAVLVLIWAGCELLRPSARATLPVAGGCAALLVSLPGVLVGAAAGLALLVSALRTGRPNRRVLLTSGTAWTAAALITVAFAQWTVNADTRAYMETFWVRGFPPPPWQGVDALMWVPGALTQVLGFALFHWLAEEWLFSVTALLLVMAAVPGAWWLTRRHGYAAAMVMAPVVVAAIAAAARVLPLNGRVSLWLGPPLLLLATAGVAAAVEWLPPRLRLVPNGLGIGAGALAVVAAVIIEPPPFSTQEMRPILEQVAAAAHPADRIYVYYGARLAVRYYGPGLGLVEWTEGRCHRGESVNYLRELDAFRGEPRVWVIWTHALARYGEPEAIRSYLGAIGLERMRIDEPSGSAQALLYDLSNSDRLALTTADTHTIPPPEFPDEGRHVPCGGPANDASVVR